VSHFPAPGPVAVRQSSSAPFSIVRHPHYYTTFLIPLLIWAFPFLIFIRFSRSLAILFILSKSQLLLILKLPLAYILLILALILIILFFNAGDIVHENLTD
jgi:hypothetical protein